jgi:neutral ceramidase
VQRRTFLAALPGTAMAVPQLTAQAGAPTAGCAERDVTPQVGMEQPGGYGKVYHKTVHDACKVRAAVLDDGAGRVALVGVDALMVPRRTVLAAREAIQKRCGILPAAIMIGASHSHSSGPTGMVQPGEFEHASQLARQLAYEKSSAADAGYLRKVEAGIVDAVCAADAKRGPGRVGFGAGVEDKAAFNRRFLMQNGLTVTHPGKGNPDVVKAAGPIDPAVTVLGCWDARNNLAGCVVNYACHATTSPGGISANWIYYLEQTIRGSFGPGVVVVFLAGFCGDVTQVDNLDPHVNPTAENWARIVGGRVGAEAVKVLLSMWPDRSLKLAHAQKLLRIDRRIPDRGRVKRCLEIARQDPKAAGATDWTFAKEIVLLDALIARERQVEVELQAIQAGPAVFLAAPGEMFCQLGLDLRARSRFPFTVPVELANGCAGYVPTAEAFGPHGGGYETRLTSYSNLEVAAGAKMVDALSTLAAGFVPAPVPEPPNAPPAREAWSYGNVPPELS